MSEPAKLPLRLDKIEKAFIRFEQNGQLKSYAFEIIADLRALQKESERLTGRIMQHRKALGYTIAYAVEDDPEIKNHEAESLHTELADKDKASNEVREGLKGIANAIGVAIGYGEKIDNGLLMGELLRLNAILSQYPKKGESDATERDGPLPPG